jgi:hypothetical protein
MGITLQHGLQLPACRVPLGHLPVRLASRFTRGRRDTLHATYARLDTMPIPWGDCALLVLQGITQTPRARWRATRVHLDSSSHPPAKRLAFLLSQEHTRLAMVQSALRDVSQEGMPHNQECQCVGRVQQGNSAATTTLPSAESVLQGAIRMTQGARPAQHAARGSTPQPMGTRGAQLVPEGHSPTPPCSPHASTAPQEATRTIPRCPFAQHVSQGPTPARSGSGRAPHAQAHALQAR